MSTHTLTALYDRYEEAATAVHKIEAMGVPHADISIVGNNEGDRNASHLVGGHTVAGNSDTAKRTEDGAGTGASLGTVLGGGAGLLAGLGLLAIPGIGPVVAAGWLVATLTGAGVGAAIGGLAGSLTGAGLSEADAHTYAEGVRRGGTLVTVRTDELNVPRVMSVLEEHGSVDIDDRAKAWQADGWSSGAVQTTPSIAAGSSRVRSYPTDPTLSR